jgi:uncharacterized protein YqeY
MTLEEKVSKRLVDAMKAKDQGALRALRAIKAEILLYKTSGTTEQLNESGEIKILQKMVKQRKDSLSIYIEQSREDLADKEREEIAVIESFLPAQMDEVALKSFLSSLIEEMGVREMKDMGRVIGEANKKLAGQADGKSIAATVKLLLDQNK